MFVEIETDKLMYTIKRERHTSPPLLLEMKKGNKRLKIVNIT